MQNFLRETVVSKVVALKYKRRTRFHAKTSHTRLFLVAEAAAILAGIVIDLHQTLSPSSVAPHRRQQDIPGIFESVATLKFLYILSLRFCSHNLKDANHTAQARRNPQSIHPLLQQQICPSHQTHHSRADRKESPV